MRFLLVLLGCWAGFVAAQSPFASMWGAEWHEGPWEAPVPTEGVNSTAHEMLLGATDGGLVVGRMNVQFDVQWWEQTSDWSPFVTSRLGRPDVFDALAAMGGWGLKSPDWPGLGEVTHLAYDPSREWAVLSAYRDAEREDVDLFLVSRTREGWTEPRPLTGLNTPFNEVFPNWIGGRLVFGSDRPGGAGGFDLYVSDRWMSFEGVERLGEPLNGPGDDVAAMATGEGWYVCTARRGGQGGLDVWWVGRAGEREEEARAADWSVRVVRGVDSVWEGAELEVRGMDGGIWLREVQDTGWMPLDGVPLENQFTAVVNADEPGDGLLELRRTSDGRLIRLPLRSGVPFVLNLLALELLGDADWAEWEDAAQLPEPFSSVQILFAHNATLLDELAVSELSRWWDCWMGDAAGPITGELIVSGFADASGTAARNNRLSRLRAEAVRDWLVAHGAPADQVVVRAQSDRNPLSDEGWERVERLQPRYAGQVPCERRVEVRWGAW
jgi:outer membrane protein OmpA-like peptidoglycan-associated protein